MRHVILSFLCLVAAIAYIQRAALSVPALEVAKDFGVPEESRATVMGWVQSVWYLGYALLQMPSGWLADRYGSRMTLAGICVLWSLLTFLTGLSFGIVSLAILAPRRLLARRFRNPSVLEHPGFSLEECSSAVRLLR
jgi:MFS family permease